MPHVFGETAGNAGKIRITLDAINTTIGLPQFQEAVENDEGLAEDVLSAAERLSVAVRRLMQGRPERITGSETDAEGNLVA